MRSHARSNRRRDKAVTGRRSNSPATYLARLKEIIDLDAIKKAGLRVAFDPLWGAARGYPDPSCAGPGSKWSPCTTTATCSSADTLPSPTIICSTTCAPRCRSPGAHIGIATDGDADRFGILDQDGTFFSPNYIIALLFDYLVETRGWSNGVAKSVATTNLVNALAEHHKIALYETPVGFKYIGELIDQDKIAIGGEESAGPLDSPPRPGKRRHARRPAVLRNGGAPRTSLGEH